MYIEPYEGNADAALSRVRNREFRRLFVDGHAWDDLLPPGESFETIDDLDELWEQEEFGSEGTHTIVDVWEFVASTDYDDDRTVRPLTAEESTAAFGTAQPTRMDFERAVARYREGQPGSEALWDMPRWSAWYTLLEYTAGTPRLIAFWGLSGD
jgi:hypothetical protein